MSKLSEIAKRNWDRANTHEDASYLLTRLGTAERLIERIKRFQPKVGPQAMTPEEIDDLEAWCEWHDSRRDEIEEEGKES